MSKSLVEKYEQILHQDPSSTVFVELARAYLERGDHDRAIAVCQQGIVYHPGSVVGRVLWGKALINAGRAAEAMKQFDLASSIDKDNPHAYNLISEALLRKGLYRSALPVLRKAAALQPNDGRIAQWLEQTKAALSGGPPPALGDAPLVPEPAPPSRPAGPARAAPAAVTPGRGAPAAGGDPFASVPSSAAEDPDAMPTVVMGQYTPEQAAVLAGAAIPARGDRPGPPVPSGEMPAAGEGQELPTDQFPLTSPWPEVRAPHTPSEEDLPVVVGQATSPTPPPSAEVDPFADLAGPPSGDAVVGGLTSTFEALASQASATVPPGPRITPGPAPELPPPPPPVSGGLLDELPPPPADGPLEVPGADSAPRPAPRSAAISFGLLDEIPDAPGETSQHAAPRPAEPPHEASVIARAYEQELKAKLEASKTRKSFLQRNWVPLVAVVGVVVLGGALLGSFALTRARNQGETLDTALAKALAAINADTVEQYRAALKAVDQALSMDEGNPLAQAYQAYASAMLFAEHGADPADRARAVAALSGPVRAAHPEHAVVVDALVASAEERAPARQALLGSTVDRGLVHAHAGRILLEDRRYDDALNRLKKALELDSRQTLALVALGQYYLRFQDWASAYDVFERLEPLSPSHPLRVLGLAEARLALHKEEDRALADLEALPGNARVPPAQEGRYRLLLGRALTEAGKADRAVATLTEGLKAAPDMALRYQLALSGAHAAQGAMAEAQASAEQALKLEPTSEEVKEHLGRILLARSREKELLDRLKADKDQRAVWLVRGIAHARLGDTRRARDELSRTQVGGKYPAEAVVYLALADAADEQQVDRTIELLTKLSEKTARHKATVQLALARAYLAKKDVDRARAELEQAAQDPRDYEASALLGQLLLQSGAPPQAALEPLLRSVERNGSHAPGRHALTGALLALGRTADAAKNVDALIKDNPTLELAWKDAARVAHESGRLKDAEAALARVSGASDDVELWRLKARVAFARADIRGAMGALERANRLNPRDAETFCEIGHAFVRQGAADNAARAFEAAVRESERASCAVVGPLHARPTARGRPSPRERLTQLLARPGLAAWDRALASATLARVYLEERDVKQAQAAAEEATAIQPAHPAGWFALGEVRRRQKNEDGAREAFARAVELDAGWAEAQLALADALARQGTDLPRAIAAYEVVAAIDQNEGEANRARKAAATLRKQAR